ncbi:MAG: hypothetical protein HRT44_02710 [Bdellovibrionales bacterium]|nr:hypothetical protein [Bdellovibrionales bacterium]NQZ18158.1 hypothetical protein [Bdellovibrionales bacterium]
MEQTFEEPNRDEFVELFDIVTSEFGELARLVDAPIKSDPIKVRDLFLNADETKQKEFLSRIKSYSDLLRMSNVEDIGVWRDKRFLWNSFKKLNVLPPSDLFENIEAGDYIEVYDPNGIQLFSNFEFCAVVSYTFEEIIWYPWQDLFGRDLKYTDAIFSEFGRCFEKAKGPFKPNIDDHRCWEIMSEEKRTATVTMKMFAPIFGSDGQPKALLATSKIQLLN